MLQKIYKAIELVETILGKPVEIGICRCVEDETIRVKLVIGNDEDCIFVAIPQDSKLITVNMANSVLAAFRDQPPLPAQD